MVAWSLWDSKRSSCVGYNIECVFMHREYEIYTKLSLKLASLPPLCGCTLCAYYGKRKKINKGSGPPWWGILCPIAVVDANERVLYKPQWYLRRVWGADHTGQYWHHPSASPAVIMWKVVGQHLFLNIVPNNFTARTEREVWCDRGMRTPWVWMTVALNLGHKKPTPWGQKLQSAINYCKIPQNNTSWCTIWYYLNRVWLGCTLRCFYTA